MSNDNKTKGYWWDVIAWLFDAARLVYDWSQENPFPRRKDYQKSEIAKPDRTTSEDTTGDIETRNSEPVKPVEQTTVQ